MYPNSKSGGYRNLIVALALLSLMLIPMADSLIIYTATVVITPQNNVIISKPDFASKLIEITAESGADSSATSSEDILNLLVDNDTSTGAEVIFDYSGNNKDNAQWYRLDSESSDYFKVEIRVYFSTLEVMPFDFQVFVYQPDANNINTGYYVDVSSSAIGWTTMDVSSIIHQLDGQGFMKVRLISDTSNRNRGKTAVVSELEWILTS